MAQEHQEYIQSKVNPILENLVTQLLLERPEHLAPFMIKWLSEHTKTPAAAALTEGVNELSELKAELEQLRAEVKQLEVEVGEKGSGDKAEKRDDGEESEEEYEEDDEDDVGPPPADYLKKARGSVSAEAYGNWNKKQTEFKPPVYTKTEAQKARIQSVLSGSFLFSSLDPKDLEVVIDAMQEKIIEESTRIINQGDDGDSLFVVEEGQMNCYKKVADSGEEKLVKECRVGDAFGELALLYNCPRAASVVAHERSVLWELDRETFGHIVSTSAIERRKRYEDFLKNVPILKTMEAYERSTMCDALRRVEFNKGDTILKQGEPGDTFYLVEDGECYAAKVYVEGTPPQEVLQYSVGDYFGELSLLMNEPRAATVIARTDVRLLTIPRRTFKDLMGPLEDILKRNVSNYR